MRKCGKILTAMHIMKKHKKVLFSWGGAKTKTSLPNLHGDSDKQETNDVLDNLSSSDSNLIDSLITSECNQIKI